MTAAPTPGWAIAPFVVYLLLVAALPLLAGRFWASPRNKLVVAGLLSAPVIVLLLVLSGQAGPRLLLHAALDYLSFMALLTALFTISGGLGVRGTLAGTPFVNTAALAVGAVLASVVGTTGASMLLIRPLLRANARRAHATHVVVFFIFIVSNAGGLLTPLGDPPLYMGFLRGVPFTWTFRLLSPWLFVNGALLVIFAVIDGIVFAREKPGAAAAATTDSRPLRLDGALNLVWLLGVVAVVFLGGSFGARLFGDGAPRAGVEVGALLGLATLSFKTTPARAHALNRFSWAPILEVAAVFSGVFVTMIPALALLAERGAALGLTKPWQFFWASGALSGVLDNAPTYLTFASLATSVAGGAAAGLSPDHLGTLAAHPFGQTLLAAVSCGSVFMGALTYLGNGPNFMVKAIAEQHDVRVPGFFGYLLWALAILVPLFGVVSALFF
jgi:Na+/H+ antiporter NhaD/arsenite permease-like protein